MSPERRRFWIGFAVISIAGLIAWFGNLLWWGHPTPDRPRAEARGLHGALHP